MFGCLFITKHTTGSAFHSLSRAFPWYIHLFLLYTHSFHFVFVYIAVCDTHKANFQFRSTDFCLFVSYIRSNMTSNCVIITSSNLFEMVNDSEEISCSDVYIVYQAGSLVNNTWPDSERNRK